MQLDLELDTLTGDEATFSDPNGDHPMVFTRGAWEEELRRSADIVVTIESI